eukprot:TRINITY_DN23268_c0_g1_i1.p1 TRINITY_DN23268_c0_g1~~TRINITY_DN23268_c0_g1_i1.p1  ORF type:complete len:360 (-),score=46.76 TRINITY_DN23268_c0_g1_i1:111-1190(-)
MNLSSIHQGTDGAMQASILGHAIPSPLVIVLGMPKCATTSLHEAFKSAGLQSVHWALDAGKDLSADKALVQQGRGAESRLISMLMQRARSDGLPPFAYLPANVNAVAEMNGFVWRDKQRRIVEGSFPQMDQLEDIVSYYPDAYYILNVRDFQKWVTSVGHQNDMRERLIWGNFSGLPRGAGRYDEELVAWVKAHHQRVESLLRSRKCKLLVFDIDKHGATELSDFLGHDVALGQHNVTSMRGQQSRRTSEGHHNVSSTWGQQSRQNETKAEGHQSVTNMQGQQSSQNEVRAEGHYHGTSTQDQQSRQNEAKVEGHHHVNSAQGQKSGQNKIKVAGHHHHITLMPVQQNKQHEVKVGSCA